VSTGMETQTIGLPDMKAALDRVLASRAFARAGSQASLLRYVVENAAAGQAGAIKEYTIALEVFGRSSYDPQVDSLVRVQASKLRKRLAGYYETEGLADPVRIEIPKGSYVPAFQMLLPSAPPHVRRWRFGVAAAIAAAAL